MRGTWDRATGPVGMQQIWIAAAALITAAATTALLVLSAHGALAGAGGITSTP